MKLVLKRMLLLPFMMIFMFGFFICAVTEWAGESWFES